MSTADGQVTNAVYGFTSMLAIVLASRPEYAIAAFDVGKPSFRAEESAAYKQGRPPMPDDLRSQMELVRRIVDSLAIPTYGVEGFEADDVIGTLALKAEAAGVAVTIVSGDLDCLQLVNEGTEALVPRRGITDTTTYGPDQVRQRYGLEPRQLIDYKALRGDTSDNIPGVPGVGDKTAAQLVQQYGSIESLIERLDELKEGRIKANLKEAIDQVRLNKRMVTIKTDVPVELDLERARWLRYDYDLARAVFDELEFRQLLPRLPPPDQVPVQPTLEVEVVAATDVRLVSADEVGETAAAVAQATEVAVFGLWDGPARGGAQVGLGLAAADDARYVPAPLTGPIVRALDGKPLAGHDVKEMQLALQTYSPSHYAGEGPGEGEGGRPNLRQWAFTTSLAPYLL